MTVRAQFPAVRSSLDLNFARTKRLDPRITFTRASTGTFVGSNGLIQSAASNAARFDHNPTTGESLGLLVEEARTNIWTRSEEFNNAAWNKFAVSVTANATVAPDGTSTADLLIPNTSTTAHEINRATGVTGSYSTTIYAKSAGYNGVIINPFGGINEQIRVNLSTGTINSISSGATGSMTALANGWYKITLSTTLPAGSDIYITVTNDNVSSFAGDGTSGIYIWGAQLEAGSFPTSYIPTTSSTVTRAADIASITGTNFSSWYNQNAGTIFIESRPMQLASNANIVKLRETSVSYNNIMAFIATSGSNQYYVSALGLNVTSFSPIASYSISQFNKAAGRYSLNSFNAAINGTIGVADTSGNTPINIDALGFGAALGQPGEGNSSLIVRRLAYYPVRLPDAQLQELTK